MKAIEITGIKPNCVMNVKCFDSPMIQADEVLVKIYAAGINRADLFQVEGSYPPSEGISMIPGLEVAGVIAKVGSEVKEWKLNDRVCALLLGGGYAEYVNIPASMLLPIPNNLNFINAACLPEAIYTAYFNLITKAKLKKKETVFITAGASGIGSMAIQIAKNLGAYVITSASNDKKKNFCLKIGADQVVGYNEKIDKKIDIILDMFGGREFSSYIHLLNYGGRLINISVLSGARSDEINLGSVLLKNITIFGSTLRSQTLSKKAQLTAQIKEKIWPLLEQNKIFPILDKVFKLEEANEAHNYMRLNKHLGKIVLQVNYN